MSLPKIKSVVWSALGMLLLSSAALAAPAGSQCPSPEEISPDVHRLLRKEIQVKAVNPLPYEGLCEVQAEYQGQSALFYTNSNGEFFIVGRQLALLDVTSGQNLTQESMTKLNRFTDADMKKLADLEAFTLGQGDKVLYYATDPQCPYCKRGEQTLKELAGEGQIEVRFLLYPLAMHKGAKEQSVSVICDEKGLEGFHSGYTSDNQCEEGVKKVEGTVALLKSKGIRGTPAYIFSDGKTHTGLLPEDQLRERLGLSKPEAGAEKPQEGASSGDESTEGKNEGDNGGDD